MKINYQGLSLDELIKQIENNTGSNKVRNFSSSDWKKFFGSAFVGFATTRYNLNPDKLFRSRINFDYKRKLKIDFYNSTNELWSPDPKCITRQGRCNEVEESILYCSDDPAVNLFEIRPEKGLEMTTIEHNVLQNIENLNIVGAQSLSKLNSGLEKLLKKHFVFRQATVEEIQKILFIDNPSPHHYVTQITHSSQSITKEGKINWVEDTGPIEYLTDLPLS